MNAENDPKPQADKFRDLARELECDEDDAAFEDKVRKVVAAPSPVQKPNGRKVGEQGQDHD